MKKTFIFLFICITINCYAQKADFYVCELANKLDWFALNNEYPKLKDSVRYDHIRLFAEGILSHYFNRPQESIEKLTDLVNNHQQKIGTMTALNLIPSIMQDYEFLGKYKIIAEKTGSVLETTKGQPIDLRTIQDYYNRCKVLESYPAQTIYRKNKDIIVKFSEKYDGVSPFKENKTIDSLIYFPVTCNGKTYQFILDTGAKSTFLSKRFAKEIGAKMIEGYEDEIGTCAFIDSLQIGGGITFKNIIAVVDKGGSPGRAVNTDGGVNVDAILGIDFLRLVGEIRIDFRNHTLTFPYSFTPKPQYGSNIRMDDSGGIALEVRDSTGLQQIIFDTGVVATTFNYRYFKKHENELLPLFDKTDKREITGGGLSSSYYRMVMRVPAIKFDAFGKSISVKDKFVAYTPNDDESWNAFGMDFVKQFNKVTINFKDMFMTVE